MIEPQTRYGSALYWKVIKHGELFRFATFEQARVAAISFNDGVDDFVVELDSPCGVTSRRSAIWVRATSHASELATQILDNNSTWADDICRVLREAWHLPPDTEARLIIEALRIPSEFRRAVFLATLKDSSTPTRSNTKYSPA